MTKVANTWDSVIVDYQLPAKKVEGDLAAIYPIFLSYHDFLDFTLKFLVGVETGSSYWALHTTKVFTTDNLITHSINSNRITVVG
jgi:hypothetical protein